MARTKLKCVGGPLDGKFYESARPDGFSIILDYIEHPFPHYRLQNDRRRSLEWRRFTYQRSEFVTVCGNVYFWSLEGMSLGQAAEILLAHYEGNRRAIRLEGPGYFGD